MDVKFSPRIVTVLSLITCLLGLAAFAQTSAQSADQPGQQPPRAVHSRRPVVRDTTNALTPALCASCVQSNLSYLAGPALHGRGSGTADEHHAAEFIAGKLKAYGLEPAGSEGQFIQTGTVRSRQVIGKPMLTVNAKTSGTPQPIVLTHGKQIVIAGLSQSSVSAALRKLDLSNQATSSDEVIAGAALLIKLKPETSMEGARKLLEPYRSGKAALVIIALPPAAQKMFDALAKQAPQIGQQIGNQELKSRATLVIARQNVFDQLWSQPDGTTVTLQANITPWKETHTWNVLGKIEGTTQKDQIVLLTAHLDHLGVVEGETYYGADDDASGTAAVMELARVLANEPKPSRTIVVALWGSEEEGMVGVQYFLQNPTFMLKNIVANLEFEMIGRPDPKVKPDELWLTGWDRTNLGPALAQHGAKLVADPHPAERFFSRSDNYALAQQGIVAQTVSSFGLHKDYHQPTDTVASINFSHMDGAISSMIGPVTWLANTDFTPQWIEGKKP